MAGNAVRQPFMKGYDYIAPFGLEHSDDVMRNAFCVGCNHTITEEEAHKIGQVVKEEITR